MANITLYDQVRVRVGVRVRVEARVRVRVRVRVSPNPDPDPNQLRVPASIAPGEWVLGFRWDCESSAQVWQSCADITITN